MILSCDGITAVLPEPQLNDTIALRPLVDMRTMADGSTRTLLRRTPRRRLGFTLILTLERAEELLAIFRRKSTSRFTVISQRASFNFTGYLITNPLQIVNIAPEQYSLTLEFQ